MRRALILGSLAVPLALGGLLLLIKSSAAGPSAVAAVPAAADQLPISQVVLFSSGVGFFQREGEVQGNTRVDLTFPIQDINDLLKSMVLQDMGGGRVAAVSYDSQAPVDKTLRSFAINFTENPSFAQILNQARGEKIEAVLQQSNTTQPANITGVVLGVEQQMQATAKDQPPVAVALLNLWCAEGMRSVKLSEVQRVRFLNPVLDSEVKKALEVLALSHDTQKKAVSLSFAGEGKRAVKVGYVVENPIWKTSYRLVLDKKGKPFLQGWAVVENTQDEDWNNVRMALVSGRPISFQMDLYQPLYVNRPVVEPELFASLRPPTYSGSMTETSVPGAIGGRSGATREMMFGFAGGQGGGIEGEGNKGRPRREHGIQKDGNLVNDAIGADPEKPTNYNVDAVRRLMDERLDLQKGVASAAAGMNLGDFFQYIIEQPVNLPRQKSAMLPIVNQEVEADRVSIYNQSVHAKFPLLGLKFRNTTPLHLMQGPVTVFEGGTYAGDSRFQDIQPKEERLLSYAIDLGVEVEPVLTQPAQRLIAVKINKGVLEATHKIREARVFNVKNRTEHDRVLLIEHPFRQTFKLITPEKAAERARDVYRFEVKVAAGQTAKQEVVEESDIAHFAALNNIDDQSIQLFLTSPITSDKVKDALKQVADKKNGLANTQRDLAHANQQLNEITQDQARLRANLKEMPPTAAAYKRYLDKFDQQETEIESLRDKIKKLQETQLTQRKGLDTYLAGLKVE